MGWEGQTIAHESTPKGRRGPTRLSTIPRGARRPPLRGTPARIPPQERARPFRGTRPVDETSHIYLYADESGAPSRRPLSLRSTQSHSMQAAVPAAARADDAAPAVGPPPHENRSRNSGRATFHRGKKMWCRTRAATPERRSPPRTNPSGFHQRNSCSREYELALYVCFRSRLRRRYAAVHISEQVPHRQPEYLLLVLAQEPRVSENLQDDEARQVPPAAQEE